MQHYETWIPMNYQDDLWNGQFLRNISKLGFIDKDTNAKIKYPKKELYGTSYRGLYDINFKWSKDFYGTCYFNMVHDSYNNLYFTFNCQPFKNTNTETGLWDYGTTNPLWFNFISLANNGFFINTCSGPNYNDSTQPLPIIVDKEIEDLARGDYIHGMVGFFPIAKNNQFDFTYIHYGRWYAHYSWLNPEEANDFLYPTRCTKNFTTYGNSTSYPRTIDVNTNNIMLIKMPWGETYLENLFLTTMKPASLKPGNTFAYNNKNYLLLFNNFVVEVE